MKPLWPGAGVLLLCAACRSEDVELGPAIIDQPVTEPSGGAAATGGAHHYSCDEALDLSALVAAPPKFGNALSLYVDDAELDALRARLAAGTEPWASAFDQALCEAQDALDLPAFSVTFTSDPSNDFRTDDPACGWTSAESPCGQSCCPGTFSPNADRDDYLAAINLGRAVRSLGLAYRLTGAKGYAAKAVSLINTWFLAPETAMNPAYTGVQDVEMFVTMPGIYYAANLVWDDASWAPGAHEAFQLWITTLAQQFAADQVPGGFSPWLLVFRAASAISVADDAALNQVFEDWKIVIAADMSDSGAFSGNLEDATFELNALSQVAELARHHGVDLFHFVSGGKGLELGFDYHAPFAAQPESWTGGPGRAHTNWSVYELAYREWRKPEYLAVIESVGRPMNESRIIGPITLTHTLP
jgi:hypothetical protein